MKITRTMRLVLVAILAAAAPVRASGHGPVFGAATPTLGRGGWSLDQAWTLRAGDDDQRQQMLKTMLSRLAAGESIQTIAQDLQAQMEGAPPGTVPVTEPSSPTD